MTEIPPQLQRWKATVDFLSTRAASAKAAYSSARKNLIEAKAHQKAIEEAQIIAQTVAQDIQEKVHNRIASVVTRCLTAVFDEPYQFKILFERKRGRTEAVLLFERDGQQIDPMTASGGGPVDLAAFALRLSCIMLARPKLRRVIILDEPFKSPSPHYRRNIRDLLKALSEEMSVQFIMVTNIMELVTGEVIDLEI